MLYYYVYSILYKGGLPSVNRFYYTIQQKEVNYAFYFKIVFAYLILILIGASAYLSQWCYYLSAVVYMEENVPYRV